MPYQIPRDCAAMREEFEWLLEDWQRLCEGNDRVNCARAIADTARRLARVAMTVAELQGEHA